VPTVPSSPLPMTSSTSIEALSSPIIWAGISWSGMPDLDTSKHRAERAKCPAKYACVCLFAAVNCTTIANATQGVGVFVHNGLTAKPQHPSGCVCVPGFTGVIVAASGGSGYSNLCRRLPPDTVDYYLFFTLLFSSTKLSDFNQLDCFTCRQTVVSTLSLQFGVGEANVTVSGVATANLLGTVANVRVWFPSEEAAIVATSQGLQINSVFVNNNVTFSTQSRAEAAKLSAGSLHGVSFTFVSALFACSLVVAL
jgi:hypothetical protein